MGGWGDLLLLAGESSPPLTEALTKRRQRGEGGEYGEDLGGNVGFFFFQ